MADPSDHNEWLNKIEKLINDNFLFISYQIMLIENTKKTIPGTLEQIK